MERMNISYASIFLDSSLNVDYTEFAQKCSRIKTIFSSALDQTQVHRQISYILMQWKGNHYTQWWKDRWRSPLPGGWVRATQFHLEDWRLQVLRCSTQPVLQGQHKGPVKCWNNTRSFILLGFNWTKYQGYEEFCRKTELNMPIEYPSRLWYSWNIAGDGGVPQNFAVTILKHQKHDM